MSAAEIPSDDELAALYQREYFFGQEYHDYTADRPALESTFRRRLARYAAIFGPVADVVEVGCAYGYFLNLLSERVRSAVGFDVSADGTAYARDVLGVDARNADFSRSGLPAESADAVVMWDVIEHLSRPQDFVREAARILRPGGSLLLTTGDLGAALARVRGEKWRMIHPPTHLHYFTVETMGTLLGGFGLRVVSVKHTRVDRNVGSVLHQLQANRRAVGRRSTAVDLLLRVAAATRADRMNLSLNTLDIMEVVARKDPVRS